MTQVRRFKVPPPAVVVRYRPQGSWVGAQMVLGSAFVQVEVGGRKMERPTRSIGGAKRLTTVVRLTDIGDVRVVIESSRLGVIYVDRIFEVAEDELLLLVAIDRFWRMPGSPIAILEYANIKRAV